MTTWTPDELARIDGADELQVTTLRGDGSPRSPRTIWVVRDGDDLYVRSVYGVTSVWYRGTRTRHEGRVQAGGVDRDVTFVDVGDELDERLDAEYRSKYRRYAASIVDSITSAEARAATIRLVPR
ncbi:MULTISPECIES: DUF2255 family protein [Actinoalloteichus]|uniref:DUF2255 family protein n=1 Tax=Actinoalloteichus fjordicus TaxID=1612552 RepID=A0AAC9PTV0_9PSEU|nr:MULTISPECIES: DUF2255 family protein [Actinoalloteichus]APU16432.1 hypothetical protein UA74_22070 [Actinoalloteichus fjordicus]APU22490.1 hypothetical protein UA75_22540 [Actinoalloteichus sp. GBA129-24]